MLTDTKETEADNKNLLSEPHVITAQTRYKTIIARVLLSTGMSIKNVLSILNLSATFGASYFKNNPEKAIVIQLVSGSIVYIVGLPFYLSNAKKGIERLPACLSSKERASKNKLLLFSMGYSISQAGTLILAGLYGSDTDQSLKITNYFLSGVAGVSYFLMGFANVAEALENVPCKIFKLSNSFLVSLNVNGETIQLNRVEKLISSLAVVSHFVGASLLFSELYFSSSSIAVKTAGFILNTSMLGLPSSITPYGISVVGLSKHKNRHAALPTPQDKIITALSFATSAAVNGLPSAWISFNAVVKGVGLVSNHLFNYKIPSITEVVNKEKEATLLFWILTSIALLLIFLPSFYSHTINKAYPIKEVLLKRTRSPKKKKGEAPSSQPKKSPWFSLWTRGSKEGKTSLYYEIPTDHGSIGTTEEKTGGLPTNSYENTTPSPFPDVSLR